MKSGNGQAEDYNEVGSDFFATLGIKIIAGRGFTSQDAATSPKVAVINQALARKRFPNVNPIGRMFRADRDKPDLTRIVGICSDTYYYHTLREGPPPQFFLPYVQQTDFRGMTYQLRTTLSTGGSCNQCCAAPFSLSIAICRLHSCAHSVSRSRRRCKLSGL